MTLTEFHAALRRLTVDDIHGIARSLASDTAGDEVDAWHATIAIDRALRHSQRARLAAHAARDAAQAVQRVAEENAVDLPDVDVTHVARAAAEIARGMVAGDDVAVEVNQLLQHWFPVFVRV
jgi:Tfp pilus assembly pilus retraction ATPase PilT